MVSRFPAVKAAAYQAVGNARDEALKAGQEETQKRIGKAREQRGYDLDPYVVQKENIGHQSGRIFVPPEKWYYRFFEYGTVYIAATPFMRPAHRVMRKTFRGEMGDNFEKFLSSRAGIRRIR